MHIFAKTTSIHVINKFRLRVTEVHDTIRLITYEFLFIFHCNYGRILYRFRNKVRYWSKNAKFAYHLYLYIYIFIFIHHSW